MLSRYWSFRLKTFITLVISIEMVGQSAEASSWRSNSGKTNLPELDSICWGNSSIENISTVFGNLSVSGSATFEYIKSQGCNPGDTLQGNFNLSNSNNFCRGLITVTWKPNNNAYIKWDITNAGSACPIETTHWEINTYPVNVSVNSNRAFVFAPPSNVRATINGDVVCSLKTQQYINVYNYSNGWYETDICGGGYIHESQLRF